MNKIEFFELRRGTDNKPEVCIETGMPMVLFSEDKSIKLLLAYYHCKDRWCCTELYTGLFLETGTTKAELLERIAQTAGRIFEIDWNNKYYGDKYWNQSHQFIADAYRHLDEARPSGLFGRHSLSQELIEYITAPTFKEAIHGGKEE